MRRRAILKVPLLALPLALRAQPATLEEDAAREAVHRIVRHSGLQPNFVVREDPGIPTAIAYIKDKQRVIA